jgi:hypothetical protein
LDLVSSLIRGHLLLVEDLREVVADVVFVLVVVALVVAPSCSSDWSSSSQRAWFLYRKAVTMAWRASSGWFSQIAAYMALPSFTVAVAIGHREHLGRVVAFVVHGFADQAFRVREADAVDQGEGHHVDVVEAVAAGVFRHQRLDHHVVVLAVGRIAQRAVDLAFQFARLEGEFRMYFFHGCFNLCR